jgi:hypothetical protein
MNGLIGAASLVLLLAACDQTDSPAGPSPSNADVKTAQATRVTTPTSVENEPAPDPAVGAEIQACRAAIEEGRTNPAKLNELVRNGCGSLIQNEACTAALSGSHEAFWETCLEAYCPLFEKEKRTSITCESDFETAERASNLALRASFLTDIMLMERDVEQLDDAHYKALRSIFESPPEERQAQLKAFIAKVLKSRSMSLDQKQLWSLGMVMAIVKPIAPPIQPVAIPAAEPVDPHAGHNH